MTDRADKDGKAPFELIDLPFLESMAKQLQAGLDKADRVPDGWKQLDPSAYLPKYRAALMRHWVRTDEPFAIDHETGQTHWAAIAVNAMICAYFERQLQQHYES